MNNRQIKFRVWDIVNKDYTYSPNRQFLIGLDGSLFDGSRASYEEDHIIQQFTGLKDKEGREIYEGDILIDNWGDISEVKLGTFQVDAGDSIFDGNGFFTFTIKGESEDSLVNGNIFRVIGNIFENPELLR